MFLMFISSGICRQPGYKQMKVLRQERNTVCFIEFDVSFMNCLVDVYFAASI